MDASTPLLMALLTVSTGPALEHVALQPMEQQMSCRHLKYRADRAVQSLGYSTDGQVSFVRLRNGHPVGRLVHEPVYRVRFAMTDPALDSAARGAQAAVVWGAGSFDVRSPNGRMDRSRLEISQDSEGPSRLAVDVQAADVCYGARLHVAFLSDCPLESLRFDLCDHDAASCLPQDVWQSPEFVTQWWKCGNSTRVDFDLSALAQELGRRTP